MKDEHIIIKIGVEMKQRIKIACVKLKLTLREFVMQAIEEKLRSLPSEEEDE